MTAIDPQHQPEAPRERRLDARRNLAAIIEAARLALAEDPGASMQDIAERARLHRATVHRHFSSREDLVHAVTEASYAEAERRLAEADIESGDARAALQRATRALLEVIDRWRLARYGPVFGTASDESRQAMRVLMVALFERGQQQGTIRTDLEPAAMSIAWGGLLSVALAYFETMDIDAAADLIVQVLLGPP